MARSFKCGSENGSSTNSVNANVSAEQPKQAVQPKQVTQTNQPNPAVQQSAPKKGRSFKCGYTEEEKVAEEKANKKGKHAKPVKKKSDVSLADKLAMTPQWRSAAIACVGVVLISGGLAFAALSLKDSMRDEKIKETWNGVTDQARSLPDVDWSGYNNGSDDTPAYATRAALYSTDEYGNVVGDGDNVNSFDAYTTDPFEWDMNLTAIQNINSNAIGWIYVPGTVIDYPIMQEQVEGSQYYLNHDIYGNSCYIGSIFRLKDPDSMKGRNAHETLYGHQMSGGQMFGDLKKYADNKSFCDQYPYVYVYYPDRTERWVIFSTYRTTQDDTIYAAYFNYYSEAWQNEINDMINKAAYKTIADRSQIDFGDRILTLSTCMNIATTKNRRFVVNCMIDEIRWYDENAMKAYAELQDSEKRDYLASLEDGSKLSAEDKELWEEIRAEIAEKEAARAKGEEEDFTPDDIQVYYQDANLFSGVTIHSSEGDVDSAMPAVTATQTTPATQTTQDTGLNQGVEILGQQQTTEQPATNSNAETTTEAAPTEAAEPTEAPDPVDPTENIIENDDGSEVEYSVTETSSAIVIEIQ